MSEETKAGLDALFEAGGESPPVDPEPAPEPKPPTSIDGATALPPRTQTGRIHYVLVQHGTLNQAKAQHKDDPTTNCARLFVRVPMARQGCQVLRLVEAGGRERLYVPVSSPP